MTSQVNKMRLLGFFLFAVLCFVLPLSNNAFPRMNKLQAVPDRLVVLTFDDGTKSNAAFVAPLLKRYGFGATFYVTEFYDFRSNCPKEHYMTWEEIRKLHEDGFEIGNHTRTHRGVRQAESDFLEDVEYIERRCEEHGIPKPKTFCYTSYQSNQMALKVLTKKGYLFARRGCTPEFVYNEQGSRGPVYDPKQDHPLLIPTAGASGPAWTFEDFLWAVQQARDGKIAVLTFHGVPDIDHPWVNTEPNFFQACMDYLHKNDYTVIAMRDLAKYVDPAKGPSDPYAPIERRLRITPSQLRCEYAVNPLGLDTEEPRLSWVLESSRRGQTQSAYQVLVAGNEENLRQNKGDLWDSGKVESDQNVHVVYKGTPLKSHMRCFWKVRVWDKENKVSEWSEPAVWSMGLLNADDWRGQWIGGGEKVDANACPELKYSAILLRKEIEIGKKPRQAAAYICGLGYYELYINGKKVGNHVLDPGFTNYDKRVLYVTYNVTDFLAEGCNCIGVVLGNGFYNATPDRYGFHKAPWAAAPKLMLNIDLDFADGTRQIIATDTSWKWSTGPIVFNSVRAGETYDARKEKTGWDITGYDDSDWQNAIAVTGPGGRLKAQLHPPIRCTQSVQPVKLTEPKPGVYVFDLGVNIAGWVQLRTSGKPGQKIRLDFNERLNPDGTLDVNNLRSHTIGRFQTDEFILKGQGLEIYEPHFTYHGFRYVQVTGLSEKPTLESVTGRRVHTDPEPAGQFSCSNEKINKIQELIIRTQLNNLHGIPTDCPQRERMGYGQDGCVTMEEAIFNFDMATFYTKWFHDMLDAQKHNGHVPAMMPVCELWEGSKPDGSPPKNADPWWGGAIILTPWKLYLYYGDRRILEQGYEAMKRYVDYLSKYSSDYSLLWGTFGDWLEAGTVLPKRTPQALTSTCAYFNYARILGDTAALLGKHEDAKKYRELAEAVQNSFNKRFLDPNTGLYASDSQTAQALPLYFGMVPPEKKRLVLDQLVRNIKETRQNHLSTGIVGTLYLFYTLSDSGYSDLAYTLATQEDCPGWWYMVRNGATTLWEAWDGVTLPSQNHPTFGCIGAWYYRNLAGIQPDPNAPGFKKIIIKPAVVGDLTWVKASYESIYGTIASNWRIEDDSFRLNVTIPVNTTATVYVPTKNTDSITESGKLVWKKGEFVKGAPGITDGRKVGEYVALDVGSGSYAFWLAGQ